MVRQGVLAAFLMVAVFGGGKGGDQRAPERGQATFADGTAVSIEVADTEAERNRGLMFRAALGEREGMLFVFARPGFYPFWMQNCRIPLDILWLDEAFRVVSMAESVPPCSLAGCEPPCGSHACPSYAPERGTSARYVIEVAAGFASRHGVVKGQPIKVELPAR